MRGPVSFLDVRISLLTEMRQMVRSDDGHRHCWRVDELHTVSHASAILSLDCFLLAECCHFRIGFYHLDPAILAVSRGLESDDPGPNELAVFGNRPHGACNTHRDVGSHLCSSLGSLGHLVRVGNVDGRRGCSSICDFLPVIHPVSQYSLDLDCLVY